MKSNKDTITINKKLLPALFALVPITAILISKHNPAVMLLWIGVFVGTTLARICESNFRHVFKIFRHANA